MKLFNLNNSAYVAFNENSKVNFLDANLEFKLRNKDVYVSFIKDNYFNLISMIVDDFTLQKATEIYMNQRFVLAFSGFYDYGFINYFDKDKKVKNFLEILSIDFSMSDFREVSSFDYNSYITCLKIFVKDKLSDYNKESSFYNEDKIYEINKEYILIKEDDVEIIIRGTNYKDILEQVDFFFKNNFEKHLECSNGLNRYDKIYSNVSYILSLKHIADDTPHLEVKKLFKNIKNELGDFFE